VGLRKPLDLSALAEFLDLRKPGSTRRVDLYHFVRRLRTLFVVGSESTIDGSTVPRIHKSFFEFITSERADKHFRISQASLNTVLASACLRVMQDGLHFNICGLKTSYVRNKDVANLTSHVAKTISSHLSYSCEFWTHHLQDAEPKGITCAEVGDFLKACFLYWLEALSLLNRVQIASHRLSMLINWIDVSMNIICHESALLTVLLTRTRTTIPWHW
jgi:hypothetical protein